MGTQLRNEHVWIREAILGQHVLRLDDFLSFPVDLRARLIGAGEIRFFRAARKATPLSETLEAVVMAWASELEHTGLVGGRQETQPDKPVNDQLDTRGTGSALTGRDRRRHSRTSMVRPVRILHGDGAAERLGISQDISSGGLRIRTRGAYQLGDRLAVAWTDADEGSDDAWYRATVVRSGYHDRSGRALFPRSIAIAFEERLTR